MKLDISFNDFKFYILDRTEMFNIKHRLASNPSSQTMLNFNHHYPNNLKYLDSQSQNLMRSVNLDGVSLEDKFITAYVYRLLNNDSYIKRYTDERGIVTQDKIINLQRYLNKQNHIEQNYTTVIGVSTTQAPRGDYLMYALDEFITALPKDDLYKYSVQEVYDQFTEYSPVTMTSRRVIFELATDLAYINELQIKDSPVKIGDFGTISRVYKQLAEDGGFFSTEEFTDYMVEWYLSQGYKVNILKYITHTDILHMVYGYVHSLKEIKRTRKSTNNRGGLEGLIIPEYIVNKYDN